MVAQALSRQGIRPEQSSSFYNTGSYRLSLQADGNRRIWRKPAVRPASFFLRKSNHRTCTWKTIGCKCCIRRSNHFHVTTCEALWQFFFSGAGLFLFHLLISDNMFSSLPFPWKPSNAFMAISKLTTKLWYWGASSKLILIYWGQLLINIPYP